MVVDGVGLQLYTFVARPQYQETKTTTFTMLIKFCSVLLDQYNGHSSLLTTVSFNSECIYMALV